MTGTTATTIVSLSAESVSPELRTIVSSSAPTMQVFAFLSGLMNIV